MIKYGKFGYSKIDKRWQNIQTGEWLPKVNVISSNGRSYTFLPDGTVKELVLTPEQKIRAQKGELKGYEYFSENNKSNFTPKVTNNWFNQAKSNTTKENHKYTTDAKYRAEQDKQYKAKQQTNDKITKGIVNGITAFTALGGGSNALTEYVAKPVWSMITHPINTLTDMAGYIAADKGLQKAGLTDNSLGGAGKYVRMIPATFFGGWGADAALNQIAKRTSAVVHPTYLPFSDAKKRVQKFLKEKIKTLQSLKDQLASESISGYTNKALTASPDYNKLVGLQNELTTISDKVLRKSKIKEINSLKNKMRSQQVVKDEALKLKEKDITQKIAQTENSKANPLVNYLMSNSFIQASKVPYALGAGLITSALSDHPVLAQIASIGAGRYFQNRLGETLYARSGGQRGFNNVKDFLLNWSSLPKSDSPFARYGKVQNYKPILNKVKGVVNTLLTRPGDNYTGIYKSNLNATEVASGSKFANGVSGGYGSGVRGLAYRREETPFFDYIGSRKLSPDDVLIKGDSRRSAGEQIDTYLQKGVDLNRYTLLDGKPILVNGRLNPEAKLQSSTKNIPLAKAPNYVGKKGKVNSDMWYVYDQTGHLYVPIKDSRTGEVLYLGIDYNGPGSGVNSDGGFLQNSLRNAFADMLWKPAHQTEILTVSKSQKGIPIGNQEGKLLDPIQ